MMAFLSWIFSGPLNRLLSTIDNKVDNQTKRDEIKSEVLSNYITAQASILTGRGWWFPLLFLVPVGLWFNAVVIYSIFWCQKCAFPQVWTIAALPEPLNTYVGWMINSIFIGKAGEAIIKKWKD